MSEETLKIKKYHSYTSEYELVLLATRFKNLKFHNLHNEHLLELAIFFNLNEVAEQATKFIEHQKKYGYTAKSHVKQRIDLWDVVINQGIRLMGGSQYDRFFVNFPMDYQNIPEIGDIGNIQFID